jgi:hypothetical protein
LKELSAHYGQQARTLVHALIHEKKQLNFDDVAGPALELATVQLSHVRAWVLEIAEIELGPRDRVAKLGCGHRVKLRDNKAQNAEFCFD